MNGEGFIRECPNPTGNLGCKGVVEYTTEKERRAADIRGGRCASCRVLGRVLSVLSKRKMSEAAKRRLADPRNHPMYGKRHTEETKRMLSDLRIGKKLSLETRSKLSLAMRGKRCGAAHPLYGKPVSVETRRKLSVAGTGRTHSTETRKKMSARYTDDMRKEASLAMRGEKNHMYGRPSPMLGKHHSESTKEKMSLTQLGRVPHPNSSKGIGGWYEGKHFRSSCELNFLLLFPDVDWVSAEVAEFRIPYQDYLGKVRYYFPDWFGDLKLVEVKPRNCLTYQQRNVPEKCTAAKRFCRKRGWEYVLIVVDSIPKNVVFKMRMEGTIELDRKWERQYQKWENGNA